MTGIKFFNLLALSWVTILALSLGATPTAAALSNDFHRVARHASVARHALMKPRAAARRCKAPPPKATPSSSSVPPKKTSPPKKQGSSGLGGGKVGLAWANGEDPALKFYKTSKTSVLYTWSPFCPSTAKKYGFNCIPMLWGDKQIGDFQRLVKAGYANAVLGMNEPNQSGQSDMSPQHGAQLWKQYIQPLAHQGYQLISPATTSAPSGMTWMKDFFKACTGCTFHGVAIHYYDVSADDFIAYITKFHDAFGLPIWPTEYACQNFNGGAQCSRDETFAFHSKVRGFMDKTSWVPHYFPFGVMHQMQGVNSFNQLMSGNGQPTDLGWMYIGS